MNQKILIVGAGPVGLSAALFLQKLPNTSIKIIEKKQKREQKLLTKAININSRTLSILKSQSPTLLQNILSKSFTIDQMNVYSNGKFVFQGNVNKTLKSRTMFPHLYEIPQGLTERLIQEQINRNGVNVQMGNEVVGIDMDKSGKRTAVTLRSHSRSNDAIEKTQQFDYVLAADGAHSTCRQLTGLKLEGQTLSQKLYLCDAIIKGDHPLQFRTYLQKQKTYFIIPIRPGLIRIAANFNQLIQYLPKEYQLDRVDWQSVENINNRTIQKMSAGNVYFAGDAAHVHASLGGRGMNAGIEDVYILSKLLEKGRISQYHSIRKPMIQFLVNKISLASSIFLSHNYPAFKANSPLLGKYLKFLILPQIFKFSAGIDTNLPKKI